MKRSVLIFAIFCLLAVPSMAGQIIGGGEMGFGREINGVGAAFTMGTQGQIGDDPNTVVRTLFTKVNFGSSNIDNVGAVLIHYWSMEGVWQGLRIGSRTSADYEIDDADIGLAAGLELVKSLYGKTASVYGYADLVKRSDINYFIFGMGIILFEG